MILDSLTSAPRLLLEAKLKPLAGTRFQPTGFPDLGAAQYKLPDGTDMLLVESAQSMANRLEAVCWDEVNQRPVEALIGLPYVESTLPDGSKTNSLLEAHRINSPYIVNSTEFAEIEAAVGFQKNKPFDRQKLIQALFKYDPSSLLHGIFLEKIGGVVRLPRMLTAFIEANNVQSVAFGGVKVDRVQPGTSEKDTVTHYGKAKDGYGNVPYHREEFTGQIKAYFCLDLSLLRGFGLPPNGCEFLATLAAFKIQRFLANGLRLRTACDLELEELSTTRPAKSGWGLPPVDEVEKDLKRLLLLLKDAGTIGKSPFPVNYNSKVAKAKEAAKEKEQKQPAEADTALEAKE
jgi:CRISPR-associated protein Csb1